ncbi:glycosyltransferase family 2 protein [Janibacter cremeus]|uniref:glycosyltransferase family 2 protein n=1 Tax=Janibacter cremeus TaxID=1285192 RepID=UPI0023F6F2B4|nr:glycosyltransferase family 2 protein [Janibacter cremeus]WEV76934.1 glycosyltransferase family 2 protein [Janibacter cremeus]
MSTPEGSIVIAAHDEEAVIARTLRPLSDIVRQGRLDVIVVCNGCRDRTADVARGFPGVRVLELPQPSKTAALREGDRLAVAGPRIYLDADITMTGKAAVETMRALTGGVVAGRPPHMFDTTGASWVVRRWYGVRSQLPSISGPLWGAGCYALSVEGRSRFDAFPEIIADDLFIDRLFAPPEIEIVDTDPLVVRTPRRLADLFRVLRRRYRTQSDVATIHTSGLTTAAQRHHLHDLRDLIRRDPRRMVDVAIYLGIIAGARLRARWGPAPRWERDASSRR